MSMTPTLIRDLAIDRFNVIAADKYDKGQAEHGGLLTDRDVIVDMEQEIVDLWFYIQALKIKLGRMQ